MHTIIHMVRHEVIEKTIITIGFIRLTITSSASGESTFIVARLRGSIGTEIADIVSSGIIERMGVLVAFAATFNLFDAVEGVPQADIVASFV